MNNSTKKCLFGGALFAAGVASHADAQQFQFELNYYGFYPTAFTVGYAYGGTTSFGAPLTQLQQNLSYTAGVPAAPAYVFAYGVGGSGYTGFNLLHAYAWSTVGSSIPVGIGQAYAYFSVADSAFDLAIDWDFSNELGLGAGGFFGDISVIDWTTLTQVFVIDLNNGIGAEAGSTVVDLEAGHFYSILLDTGATAGGFSVADAYIVPTPASAALLGLGGLVATRRRR